MKHQVVSGWQVVLPIALPPQMRKGVAMKPAAIFGIILIILGVLALTYKGFSYTDRDDVDLGPVDITVEHKESVPISPILGGLAIVGGVVLLYTSRKRA